MLTGFIIGTITWILLSLLGAFFSEGMIKSIAQNVFKLQAQLDLILGSDFFSQISVFFTSIAISIMILKVMKKGFETYILWIDGDPDESPEYLVRNLVIALVILITFLPVFDMVVDIFESITNRVFDLIKLDVNIEEHLSNTLTWNDFNENDPGNAEKFVGLFSSAIFFVTGIILYFKLYVKGVEIYILKLGLPLATIGFIDNDKGIFKEYANVIIQALTTISIQIALYKLAYVVSAKHSIIACALLIYALKVPETLNKFVITSRGGVATGVYHSGKMTFAAVKSVYTPILRKLSPFLR